MKTIESSREIAAPIGRVFEVVSDVRNFREAVPHITKIEFLTEQQCGVGTRFAETRQMKGRDHTIELEVTEFEPNQRVRLVSDAGGTVWDSVFSVRELGPERCELKLVMEARAHRFMAKIFNPLIRGVVVKGLESDMDSVKTHCEA